TNAEQRRALLEPLNTAWQAVKKHAADALQDLLSGKADPTKILGLIDSLIQGVLQQAENAGGAIADSLLGFLDTGSDAELGHALGRVEGNILFEVLLLILTEGG